MKSLLAASLAGLALFACTSTSPSGPEDTEVGSGEVVANASAPRLRRDGLLPGMIPFRDPTKKIDATPQCANPKLSYFGGPVLQSPTIVAVFWSSDVNAQAQTSLPQFYADVTESTTYWPWLHEYDSASQANGTHQTILAGSFGGAFVLKPSKCPASGATTTCKLTDADVQNELVAQINAGVLPAPTLDCTGNANTVYMVDFGPKIQVTGPFGIGKSCVQFCAYHNTGTYGPNKIPLVYAVDMDDFTGPCAGGCGGNATPLEDTTDTRSHELVEAVTDPDIGLVTAANYAYPAGWGDNANMCGEIADICDDGGAGDTITVSGRTWVVQELWSNKQNKCTSTGTPLPICSGTTTTNCRKCSCGDSGGACNGATPFCETSSTNVLFGACEQCTAASNTCDCEQSSTPSMDDICCTPLTTCPAGDECGTVPDGCGGVVQCGVCPATDVCMGNQCVPVTTVTSSTASSTVATSTTVTSTTATSTTSTTATSTSSTGGAGGASVTATTVTVASSAASTGGAATTSSAGGASTTVATTSSSAVATSSSVGGASTTTTTTSSTAGVTSSSTGMTSATVGVTSSSTGMTSTTVGATSSSTGMTTTTVGVTSSSTGMTTTTVGVTSSSTGMTSTTVGATSSSTGMTTTTVGATSSSTGMTTASSGATSSTEAASSTTGDVVASAVAATASAGGASTSSVFVTVGSTSSAGGSMTKDGSDQNGVIEFGGCGCRVEGEDQPRAPAFFGLGLAALAIASRRRSRFAASRPRARRCARVTHTST